MPRQPRLDSPGLVHHVMARGIEGQNIFRSESDKDAFLDRLGDGINRPGGPQLYAWALMSNHFHLLLRSGEGYISPMMRRLMTGHAVSYNLRYKRQGHLFQNRFKSIRSRGDAGNFRNLLAGQVKGRQRGQPLTWDRIGSREFISEEGETMFRPLRIEFPGAYYHVTARGNERKKIFISQRDYARFKEYLEIARERFGCVLHAYVLMGNHFLC